MDPNQALKAIHIHIIRAHPRSFIFKDFVSNCDTSTINETDTFKKAEQNFGIRHGFQQNVMLK